MKRLWAATVVSASVAFVLPSLFAGAAAQTVVSVNRGVEAVVMSGSQFPSWSRLEAQGLGSNAFAPGEDTIRDAHHGLVEPGEDPSNRDGVPVEEVTAFRWDGRDWKEVPVQVDQRFPYFLVNNRSDFGIYSRVDEELTYQWDIESWKKVAGQCNAEYPPPDQDPSGRKGYPTKDPVESLDDDDQISFYASDAGQRAPADARAPQGAVLTPTTFTQPEFKPRQEVELVDPTNPAGPKKYLYLFLTANGPSFDATNGYVKYQRDANADQWIDKQSFTPDDPEKLGTGHEGYGPNLSGTVCNEDGTVRENADGSAYISTDRFPRDGMTVSTPRYQVHASGRWMVRTTRVAEPGPETTPTYGPDLVDRWKGRAFQQSPDSTISVTGFEDEQVNWEANSALLGERFGPVRAIREVWGADSGTNTTKTEYYYRDFYVFRYRLRVHPIPPDGLYTSWDHNAGTVTRYYNEGMTKTERANGVPIDGRNDDVGNIDSIPLLRDHTYFDASDPTFGLPLAIYNWEEVSGPNGSLVSMFQLNNVQGAENPTVTPYYRDDSCFDDGTGDDPSPRLYPGDSYADMADKPGGEEYTQRPCWEPSPETSSEDEYSPTGPWRQGCIACHGVHFLITNDTDNAFLQKPTTEVDGQQFIWAVPTDAPANVGEEYANTVKFALTPAVTPQNSSEPKQATNIANTGPTSGRIGDRVTLSARLTDQAGEDLAGKRVRFSLGGELLGRAVTDENGTARLEVTLHGPARWARLRQSFIGDADYQRSWTAVPFRVRLRQSDLRLAVTHLGDLDYRATATLTDFSTGDPLPGKEIAFSRNGRFVTSATTNSNGRATVTLQQVRRETVIAADFARDDTYARSHAERRI